MSESTLDRSAETKPKGSRTARGDQRPEYVRNPDRSRDPPSGDELDALKVTQSAFDGRRRAGAKIWRKAREGKL